MCEWPATVPNPCSSLQTPEKIRSNARGKSNSGCSVSHPVNHEPGTYVVIQIHHAMPAISNGYRWNRTNLRSSENIIIRGLHELSYNTSCCCDRTKNAE